MWIDEQTNTILLHFAFVKFNKVQDKVKEKIFGKWYSGPHAEKSCSLDYCIH